MQKGFDSEPGYHQIYLEIKIKSIDGKINTNFHDNGVPKECSHCICLSVIFIDPVFKISKNYYSQVVLEKRKYVVKENKMSKFINDKLNIVSDCC